MSDNIVRLRTLENIKKVTPRTFKKIAIEVFRYQVKHNNLYAKYVELLGLNPNMIKELEDIPFLPIQFFKTYKILTGNWIPEIIFESSGTTGSVTSKHLVRDLNFYNTISQNGFESLYGSVSNYCFLALLPTYLDRENSSLVYMVNHFIKRSRFPSSGFFLDKPHELVAVLKQNLQQNIPTILIGVSFALLELAENFSLNLKNIIVMETGGMKGRRKEMTRPELHQFLKDRFQLPAIHSEYGMTELLSQSYSKGDGIFKTTSTLKILVRDITDPFSYRKTGHSGGVNIIDLANLDTCSFIATDDIGRLHSQSGFEILGRLDNSDIRGCNLMVGNEK